MCLQVYTLGEESKAKCSYCVSNKKAGAICEGCETFMCLSCLGRHETTQCKVIIKHYCIYSYCLYILSSIKDYVCHVTWYTCSEADMASYF